MASVAIRRVVVEAGFEAGGMERVQRRLAAGARPVGPVVEHFAKALKGSIDDDFKVGGRSPFVWKPDSRNTIAAKGHGKILIGKDGPKLQNAIKVEVVASKAPTGYDVNVNVPQIGEFHQLGKTTPWTIAPKKAGGVLVFPVAEKREDFLVRRREAQLRRRKKVKAAGRGKKARAAAVKSTRIPSRPEQVMVFTRKPVKHPGYPARKFVVVREGLIQTEWREPLRRYLFEGKDPR